MKEYEFEIQNCITVKMTAEDGEDVEGVRIRLIESLDDHAHEMIDGSCYVSDGEEVK